jgi:hypothetical protein
MQIVACMGEKYIHDNRSMAISGEFDIYRLIIIKMIINRNMQRWVLDSRSLEVKPGKAFVKIVMTFRDSDQSLQYPCTVR